MKAKILIILIFLFAFSVFAAEFQQQGKTIEEIYTSSFDIDGKGNVKHRVVISYSSSVYSEYLKTTVDILKSQTATAMENDYAIFGWGVKNVKTEVRGLGKDEALEVIASCDITNMVKKEEASWKLNITYPDPEESAKKLINKWRILQGVLFNLGLEKYTESGENAIILPKGAEIVKVIGLEDDKKISRVDYGGGSLSETMLTIGEKEGRPAIITQTIHTLTTKDITLDSQKLAEEMYGSLLIEYTGEFKDKNYLTYFLIGIGIAIIIILAIMVYKKQRFKIMIVVIAIVLIGLIGFAIWSLRDKEKTNGTTPSGEQGEKQREIRIPNIPDIELLSEEKGECSHQLEYVYKLYRDKDLSGYLEKPIRDAFLGQDWKLEEETAENGFKVFKFSSEKAEDFELMIVRIGFEPGKGTVLFLDYQWPPCSEEE